MSSENDDLKGQLLKANLDAENLRAEVDRLDKGSVEQMERIDEGKQAELEEKVDRITKDFMREKKAHDELKSYLDKILMNIMNKDPSILEV